MMKYVVCGTSVKDVEAGVEAMKMAIASGATCGVGGSTIAEVEKNLEAMKQMMGGNAPTPPKTCSGSRSVSGREVLNMIEEAKPKIGYRRAIKLPCGWHEPHEETFNTIEEVKADIATSDYPMECISIDKVSDDGGCISVIQCVKHACSVYTEDEYEDEDEEEIGYNEGYMALNEDGEKLSYLCDSPEDAMSEALGNGYDLDEIGIYQVDLYDDDTIEVIATIHRPIK